jgi:hypothetical protein
VLIIARKWALALSLGGCSSRLPASAALKERETVFMRSARALISVSCSARRIAVISWRAAPAPSAFASQRSVSAALPWAAALEARSSSCACKAREVSWRPEELGSSWRAASR